MSDPILWDEFYGQLMEVVWDLVLPSFFDESEVLLDRRGEELLAAGKDKEGKEIEGCDLNVERVVRYWAGRCTLDGVQRMLEQAEDGVIARTLKAVKDEKIEGT